MLKTQWIIDQSQKLVVWGNCLLNARLHDYTEEFMILKENQSGFRQSYSTLDNIFSIFTLFQILKSKKKKLYCVFIDFEKPLTEYGEMVFFTNYYLTT